MYVHVPFCFHKCHYCDFYSIVDDRDRQGAFARRLADELRALAPGKGASLATVFVGGGTPTLLAAEHWARVLEALHDAFDLAADAEFTVEANPETVSPGILETLRSGRVNRLSIGCQSFNERHLKTLERWHDPASVVRAVELARDAGITNINLDLIFGIPGQTLDEWRADLDAALALQPTHLSCYGLTYEPNTAMTAKLGLGRIMQADEDLEAAMYQHTIDRLASAGFEHYEISNFALPGRRCRHNLAYWLNHDWLAAGPSASGHVQGLRWKNQPHLGRYLAHHLPGAPIDVDSVERLDADSHVGEQLMLRLRLIEGAALDWLEPLLSRKRLDTVERLVGGGLLERTTTHLRLTRRGLFVADSVIAELL